MILQLSTDQLENIEKIIENAQNDNWIPLSLILGLCVASLTLISILVVYIWKTTKKDIDAKLETNLDLIALLTKNSNDHSILIQKLETMSEVHEQAIKDLKQTA